MQRCEVYYRNGSIYIVSQSSTELGLYVSNGPMLKVTSKSPEEIGTAAISALSASLSNIPQPTNLNEIQKRLFAFAGAKNWGDLARTSRYVSVEFDGKIVTVQPHQLGPSAGFMPLGNAISFPGMNPSNIGGAVLKAVGELVEDD